MIFAVLIGALFAGLVVLYLTRPYHQDIDISSAIFFKNSRENSDTAQQFHPQNLLLSRPFYLQAAVLSLLLASVLMQQTHIGKIQTRAGIGVLVILDTSASMSTMQSDGTRLQQARRDINTLADSLASFSTETPVCIRLSAFDMAIRSFGVQARPENLSQAVTKLDIRALGTDLNQLRVKTTKDPLKEEGCSITHIVVYSDLPAPDWASKIVTTTKIIWVDVGKPEDNIGIVDVSRAGNSTFGITSTINIDIAAYVPDKEVQATVTITDDKGTKYPPLSVEWTKAGVQRKQFTPPHAGSYTIRVTPGGAYTFDDSQTISVEDIHQIHVDWQLPDRSLVNRLNWVQDDISPQFRVSTYPSNLITIPTLLVGSGYFKKTDTELIDYFVESSPLLNDINLDAAEKFDLQGIQLENNNLLRPILFDSANGVWLAASESPQAVYVPGLPLDNRDNLGAFSTTVFFNAVRWLLHERVSTPLYSLTTSDSPIPEGTRGTLHPGEGNTSLEPHSLGSIAEISPEHAQSGPPLWPLLVALAALIFIVERSLSLVGGTSWY